MKAILLAGGLGTRLHPLTVNIPKPMVPVVDRPLMEYVISLLESHGFKDITAVLYYQPEVIKNYFKDGSNFGVKISYVETKEDFGTAGATAFAAKNFDETFLVISADLITDFDLKEAVKFHKKKKALATIVLTRVSNPLPYGIVILDKEGRIKHFLEKPSWSEVFSDTINSGIYVLEPEILKFIPSGGQFDFSQNLFPLLLKENKPLFGFVAEGLWRDIGNLIDYGRIHNEVLKGKSPIVSKRSKVSSSAKLEGTIYIGDNSIIGDEVELSNVSIGSGCSIGRGAILRHTVLWDNVTVGSEARLEKVIVAKNSNIGDRSFLEEGVVVGEDCHIGKDVNIKPYVKIWPSKIIEEGSIVSRSVVWRERWSRGIFGPYGVTGLCNIEITPEFASSLGAAYGSILKKGSFITTSRDSHKSSRMIYRALISGVLSSGINVSDLEMVPIPVTRYELKALKSVGGFHVRKSPYDPQVIDVKFFDDNGMDLSSSKEKKIERNFFGEEFARVDIDDVGEISFPFHRIAESYKEGVLSALNVDLIRKAKFKVVVDYAYGSSSQIFPSILGELGIDIIALNAHIDETKITKTKEMFNKELQQLSQIVKSLDADLGIMLDTGAEKIFLCDEKGNILSDDHELAVLTFLVCQTKPGARIAIPVKSSRVIEEIAKECGAKVIRTKTGFREMMEASSLPGIDFLGEPQGGFIFPYFQTAFDAMFASCKLLEMLANANIKLSSISSKIPEIKMTSKNVSCPPEKKGKVLRTILDSLKDEEVDLTDGIKIFYNEDWVLILPDPIRPVIHLYAEASKEKDAERLIKENIERIDKVL